MCRSLLALSALLFLACPASANQFLGNDPNDWFRYTNRSDAQDQVVSKIEMTEGAEWRMWSDFAGLGPTWVATETSSDWLWIWANDSGQPVADLGGALGRYQAVDLGCNRGTVRVASKYASLNTPAGTFTDVTRLSFPNSCGDAGVVSIWFAKGVGIVKYSTRSPAGTKTYVLSAALVGGRSFPSGSSSSPATGSKPVAPSEHARMESILWGCNDTYLVVDTYRDAFRGLRGTGVISEVFVYSNSVASELRYEMAQANVSLSQVEFIVAPLDSVWMRDYGPVVLKDGSGRRVVADLNYYPDRTRDDRIPRAYANYRGWSRIRVDLEFEGGNFATDGAGLAMASKGVQWFNGDKSLAEIRREFLKLGCDRVELFQPLEDEPTTHIDMFARVMNDDTALVSRYPQSHRQASVVDAAATRMSNLGYRVVRVDVDHRYDEFATYANSVLANGVALVPQYGRSATRDSQALKAYRDLGYRAVGIDSSLIIKYAGATHCLSMQVPAGQ